MKFTSLQQGTTTSTINNIDPLPVSDLISTPPYVTNDYLSFNDKDWKVNKNEGYC